MKIKEIQQKAGLDNLCNLVDQTNEWVPNEKETEDGSSLGSEYYSSSSEEDTPNPKIGTIIDLTPPPKPKATPKSNNRTPPTTTALLGTLGGRKATRKLTPKSNNKSDDLFLDCLSTNFVNGRWVGKKKKKNALGIIDGLFDGARKKGGDEEKDRSPIDGRRFASYTVSGRAKLKYGGIGV